MIEKIKSFFCSILIKLGIIKKKEVQPSDFEKGIFEFIKSITVINSLKLKRK